MDLKNITYQLMGLTVRLRMPRLGRQEETGAEYHLKIEQSQEQRVSYLQWRYGERLEEIVTASPQLPSQPPSQTERTRTKQEPDKSLAAAKLKKLKKDFRVINNYMSVQQISYIENWLQDQPEHFQTEDLNTTEMEEERNIVTDVVDRSRNILYRKVSIV